MNAKVLRVLEYDKVIHMLEQKATSDPGRQLCRDLVPMTDLAQIEQAQTETADALTRIFQKGSLNFGSTVRSGSLGKLYLSVNSCKCVEGSGYHIGECCDNQQGE